MGIKLYKEPKLENAIMFCGWPGIGSLDSAGNFATGFQGLDDTRALAGLDQYADNIGIDVLHGFFHGWISYEIYGQRSNGKKN